MTVSAPEWWADPGGFGPYYIAQPVRSVDRGALLAGLAHVQGYQMPIVHRMVWGASESTTATYRFLALAHPNVDSFYFSFLPRGHVDSVAPLAGTISVTGAQDPASLSVRQPATDIADLGDLDETGITFVKPVTGGAFAEHVYSVTDCRLHSLVVWQIPRKTLSGTLEHVDRSFADPMDFITDNDTVADPRGRTRRGEPALLRYIQTARDNMRRCWTPCVNPVPTATNPAANNTWTTVTGWDDLSFWGRNVKGSATANRMRTRVFVYAAVTGGATFEFRMVGTTTSGASAGFGGAAAWRPGSAALSDGVAWDIRSDSWDTARLECRRTAGAGTLEVGALDVIEDPL